jgi:PII-like signaling protein
MLQKGPAKKVTIYVNEDAKYHGKPLHEEIMGYLMAKTVAGATATRAMAGFGAHHLLHTPRIEALSEHLPLRIEFVETPEKVERLLPGLHEMVTDGLIEVQDTTVVKAAAQEAPEPPRPRRRVAGPARMMRIFLGEADQWNGEPLHVAIVKKLRMMEVAGATVERGIHGYGAKGHEHKRSFWHPMRDLPVTITVIDTPEKIAAAAQAVEAMLQDGMIVLSDVEAIRLS